MSVLCHLKCAHSPDIISTEEYYHNLTKAINNAQEDTGVTDTTNITGWTAKVDTISRDDVVNMCHYSLWGMTFLVML